MKSADIPGYTIARKDKPLVGTTATAGGVAFVFPRKWSCVTHEFKIVKDHFEALALILIPPNCTPIKLATCYNRPGYHLPEELLKEFNEIKFNKSNISGLFVGDFNSPHAAFGSRLTNTYGCSLLQAINKNNLIHFQTQLPTYICSSSGEPNTLDLVLGNSLIAPYFLSCHVEGDLGSDHLPVRTLLDLDLKKSSTKTRLNFANWVKMIDEQLPKLNLDNESIDRQIEMVEKIFQSSRNKCTEKVTRPRMRLPPDIMSKIKHRKRLLQLRQQAVTPQEREFLTKEYNKINRTVRQLVQDYEENQKELLATKISETKDTNAMWKLFQQYKSRNKDCDKPVTPLELENGDMTVSNEEKSTEFARHLASVHQTPDNAAFDSAFKQEVDTYFESFVKPPPSTNALEQIDVRKFRILLSKTKSNKSPGDDTITYDVMKKCSDPSLAVLCRIINNCLEENIFPSQWKWAKVIMLVKPGKSPKKPVGYRPISLISCLGKIYERYICERLVEILTERKFFAEVQAGYQKGKSSQEHLFRFTQDVYNGMKMQKGTVGVFLDVQKAFDAVWLNGLKLKIKNLSLPTQLQNLIFSFLTDRHLRVHEDGSVSDPVRLEAGTPQGSCLSPILYVIFVNDLTSKVDQKTTSVGQYADDVGLYSTHRNIKTAITHVQNALDHVMEWCRKWQVIMNVKKSQVVLFSKCPTHRQQAVNLKLFDQVIPTSNEATYLGVIFDTRLTWEHQIRQMTERAEGRLNLLKAMASISRKHNPNVLSQLYNSIIRSIFEYPSVCIVSAANVHINKLQRIQNQALRVILKVPAYIPIETMNDGGNQNNVRDHLITTAKNRIQQLCANSRLVRETIENFRKIKNNNFNTSPLDVVHI